MPRLVLPPPAPPAPQIPRGPGRPEEPSVEETAASAEEERETCVVVVQKRAPASRTLHRPSHVLLRLPDEAVRERRAMLGLETHGSVPPPALVWEEMGLPAGLLGALETCSFKRPTPVQSQAIPAALEGHETVVCAETGSGKTLAYAVPVLVHALDQPAHAQRPYCLVLAPTHELVLQIALVVNTLGRRLHTRCLPVIGGANVAFQIGELRKGVPVVVCTPGRCIQLVTERLLQLAGVSMVVVDEADRMLDRGFGPQLRKLLALVHKPQVLMLSATVPAQLRLVIRQTIHDPVFITVGPPNTPAQTIAQDVVCVERAEKTARLLDVLRAAGETQALIFVNKQADTEPLANELLRAAVSAVALHSRLDQTERASIMDAFKTQSVRAIVATSVCARGLDIAGLSLVINYDCPTDITDYVHRVGRTGRMGKAGCAVTFVERGTDDERAVFLCDCLERSRAPVPTDLLALADGFRARVSMGLVKPRHINALFTGKGYKFDESERIRHVETSDGSEGTDKSVGETNLGGKGNEGPGQQDSAVILPSGMWIITSGFERYFKTEPNYEKVIEARRKRALQHSSGHTDKPEQHKHMTHQECELEINDLPLALRAKLTRSERLKKIAETTNIGVTLRGRYVSDFSEPPPGERRLHIFLEAPTKERIVQTIEVIAKFVQDHSRQK